MSIRPAALLLQFCLFLLAADPATAHGGSPADRSGLDIPALTHGQMVVVAAYRGEIVDMAAKQSRTDETLRRLLNYASIQQTLCLWGLMPGSIGDEASPFNECSHAYLSATQAALVHMRTISVDRSAVERLVSRMDVDMVRNGASFVLCQYSGETFNTASLVRPDWQRIASHPPSLITASAGLLLATAALVLVSPMRGRSRGHEGKTPDQRMPDPE